MSETNTFTIEGKVARPPRVKTGGGKEGRKGWSLTEVVVSQLEQWTDRNGKPGSKAHLFGFAFFGGAGEAAQAEIKEGDTIRVTGSLVGEEKQSERTGGMYFTMKAKCWEFEVISGAYDQSQQQAENYSQDPEPPSDAVPF